MGFWIVLGVVAAVIVGGRLLRWAGERARDRAGQALNAVPSPPSRPREPVAGPPAARVARPPAGLATAWSVPPLPPDAPPGQVELVEVDAVGPGEEVEVVEYGSVPESPSSAPQASRPARSAGGDPTTDRYVGSAALESTLDSTIDSSLLGVPTGPVTAALLPGASTLELPVELRVQVVGFLADGHEVAAVQLVCDELHCTILEAVQTVRMVS